MKNNPDNSAPLHDKEYEAISIEEAIQKAYDDIRLPKERIKIHILTEGKRGLFGKKGSKMAKIKATIISEPLLPE